MFKKLHLKLTAYIGLILVVFMAVTTLGIYFFTKSAYEYQMKNVMENEAVRLQIYAQTPSFLDAIFPFENYLEDNFPVSNRRLVFPTDSELGFSYITYDSAMNVLYVESEDEKLAQGIVQLAIDTLNSRKDSYVTIDVEGEEYRVFTKFINTKGSVGVIQVYSDTTGEDYLWSFLSKVLFTIGIIGTFILFLISYFFTGKALNPVKESWQKQREFVADASHELRTPLTVIQTNLDVMISDEDGTIEENSLWLDNAYTETKIMANLIDQLLTLANVDSNVLSLDFSDISLSEITESVTDNLKLIALKKNISLHTEIEKDIIIKGDYDKIRRLVVILTDNALKYTEQGTVTVKLYTEKNKKILSVQDTGIGIDKEDVQRIFDRFFRSDKARNRRFGGTGLGLSIAKWIVDSHKAVIDVNSTPGVGSTFTVKF